MIRLFLVTVGLLAATACRNACQDICPRMKAYAEDCGFEVSQDELRTCIQEQSGSNSSDDRAICRQEGSRSTLREEWTCEDLSDYWAGVAAADTGEPASVR